MVAKLPVQSAGYVAKPQGQLVLLQLDLLNWPDVSINQCISKPAIMCPGCSARSVEYKRNQTKLQ